MIPQAQYEQFALAMRSAQLVQQGRAEAVRAVLEMLQEDMRLVCVTAVEDRLQASSLLSIDAPPRGRCPPPRGRLSGGRLWHRPRGE